MHLEVRDAAHWTALHHAAFEGRAQAVTLLLQAGADINTADPHVSTLIGCLGGCRCRCVVAVGVVVSVAVIVAVGLAVGVAVTSGFKADVEL